MVKYITGCFVNIYENNVWIGQQNLVDQNLGEFSRSLSKLTMLFLGELVFEYVYLANCREYWFDI